MRYPNIIASYFNIVALAGKKNLQSALLIDPQYYKFFPVAGL